jgi:hypothetical protein
VTQNTSGARESLCSNFFLIGNFYFGERYISIGRFLSTVVLWKTFGRVSGEAAGNSKGKCETCGTMVPVFALGQKFRYNS